MATLAAHRCVQHPSREAAGRCADCRGFFCRECVVEHDGRLLCAPCLAKLPKSAEARGGARARLGRIAATGAAAVAVWLFFYWMGAALVRIPPDFHDGTIWRREAGAQP